MTPDYGNAKECGPRPLLREYPAGQGPRDGASGSAYLRLPLALCLFTLTAIATLTAVLVLFAGQQHSFRQGLLDRANRTAADRAQSLLLDRREYREAGGWERLRGNPRLLRRLNEKAQGLPAWPPPRRPAGPGMARDRTLASVRQSRHRIR